MSEFAINVGISNTPKEHAVKKPETNQNPAAEAKVIEKEASRESSLQWQKVESKNKKGTELELSTDTVKINFTTVTAPHAVKAAAPALDLRKNLKDKFTGMLEKSYANIFHHNRLVAKVAEWMVGNIMERLALLGMDPTELASLKDRVREDLVLQNKVAFSQVVYDEAMLEIVA
jgi:hypothetical protein